MSIRRCHIYSTHSRFNHTVPAVDSMPRDCLQDLTQLLHFVDDWELNNNDFEWNENFNYPKDDHNHDAYAHCTKIGLIKNMYVKGWQQCVKFGCWVAADKLRLAGWYHSPCTIGSDPKLIRTSTTLHSLTTTCGKLQFYKIYARTYGGKHGGNLEQGWHKHMAGEQKFINHLFFVLMLSLFRGKGHHVTRDSAYMGDSWLWCLVLSGRSIWLERSKPIASVRRWQRLWRRIELWKGKHTNIRCGNTIHKNQLLLFGQKIGENFTKLSSTWNYSCWDDAKKDRRWWHPREAPIQSWCAHAKRRLFRYVLLNR